MAAFPAATHPDPSSPAAARWRWRALSPVSWLRALVTVYAVPQGSPWLRACPSCRTRLLARQGPAVSARARCTTCGACLGRAPWVVEATVLVALVALMFSPRSGWELPAYLWFAGWGVGAAVVDASVRRLPNVITVLWACGTAAGLLLPAVLEDRGGDWWRAVLAGLLLCLLFGAVALVPGALGWGDVKALAAVGMALGWLGWAAVYAGLFAASVLTFCYAVHLRARGRARRGTPIALGPFLVTGAFLVVALLPASG